MPNPNPALNACLTAFPLPRVYIMFDTVLEAGKCKQMMDGRMFDDRKVGLAWSLAAERLDSPPCATLSTPPTCSTLSPLVKRSSPTEPASHLPTHPPAHPPAHPPQTNPDFC
jgi:hypothetical protein